MAPDLDVLVIGGGQAGLAMGYELAQRGLRSLIVDANPAVGDAWRSRWDSLRLFTAARFNDLPGKPFPGSRDRYPGRDEVADFLQAYAAEFELPVRLDTQVTRLTREHDVYVAATSGGTIEAGQVVVATGPFQVPFIPPAAERLDPELAQLHSAGYRNPESLPPGKVLVVGAANSGIQIALELAGARTVELSVGQKLPTLPQRPLGRDIWWWLTKTGVAGSHRRLAARPAALPARRRDRRRPARAAAMRRADPAPGDRRERSDGDLRRRRLGGVRRGRLGDRIQGRPFLDRDPGGQGRARSGPPPARGHAVAGPLHARPHLAAQAHVGADRMGR